jgi:hypothetical protein
LTGKELVDYIADYLQTIRKRRVFPDVKPGYIRDLLPDEAPQTGQDWDTIFADVERVIMPGVSAAAMFLFRAESVVGGVERGCHCRRNG